MEHTRMSTSHRILAVRPHTAPRHISNRAERRRFAFIGTALACVMVAMTGCSSAGEEPSAGGTSSDDVAAPSEGVESTQSTASSEAQVETATAYWEALASDDREVAISLVDPAFLESGAGDPFGRARTLEQQFDWYDSVGWQWALQNCAMSDAGAVECTASASNAWSEALGLEPITGTFVASYSDEGIRAVKDKSSSFSSQWLPMVYFVFEEWVQTHHPEDAQVMFNFGVDVNPEILAMYQLNTERFVEAQQGQ